jgi:hypothetical protein
MYQRFGLDDRNDLENLGVDNALHFIGDDIRNAARERSPYPWARPPTPVAAQSGSVPTHKRLGPDNCENLQDHWKPAIQLDKEPAIMVREPNATTRPAPQDNQLMSKHRVLGFKP